MELSNAGEGTWTSDFIHSLRQTFAWACQGVQSKVQGGGRNPGETDSGPAIPRPFRSDARMMLGLGGFEEDTEKTVD